MSRVLKVAEAIKVEVSDIIQRHLKDPRVGFVTITHVELTADLRFARIYFSVYGDDKEKSETTDGIKSSLRFIRRELGHRLRLKFVPEIVFKLDESVEHSIRIQEVINQINKGKKNAE
ncbi:MAG: 30S ribosome-binding factor RbfA [Candidatus Omnitrophota bacterium]